MGSLKGRGGCSISVHDGGIDRRITLIVPGRPRLIGYTQEGGKAMLDGDDYYPDYEGAILEEQENDEPYGDI